MDSGVAPHASNSSSEKKETPSTPSHRFFHKTSAFSALGNRPLRPIMATSKGEWPVASTLACCWLAEEASGFLISSLRILATLCGQRRFQSCLDLSPSRSWAALAGKATSSAATADSAFSGWWRSLRYAAREAIVGY